MAIPLGHLHYSLEDKKSQYLKKYIIIMAQVSGGEGLRTGEKGGGSGGGTTCTGGYKGVQAVRLESVAGRG